MGLLDSLGYGNQGGYGGLLDLLRTQEQYKPSAGFVDGPPMTATERQMMTMTGPNQPLSGFAPPPPMPQAMPAQPPQAQAPQPEPAAPMSIGAYQMPRIGPQAAFTSQAAPTDVSAQNRQPQAPQQPMPQPAQQPAFLGGQPQGGGSLMAGLNNLNSGSNPITMLANVVDGFSTGQRHDRTGIALQDRAAAQQKLKAQYDALVPELGPQKAMLAVLNPEVWKTLHGQKSEYGVIGKDEFGNEQYGWRDSKDKSITPYKPQPAASAQPSAIPMPPPGVDPKIWRDEQSKRVVSDKMPADVKTTSALRNEVQGLPSYKNVAQAAPVYKSMLEAAGRDTRAADVNLIYGMAKIMDPGSVVRESEMTVATAIATLPQQLRATVESQLTNTGRLTPDVRAAIMQEAHGRMLAYQGMFDQDAGMYRGIAQRGRMNEADVLPSFGPFDQYRPQPKPTEPVVIDGYKIKAR